MVILDIIKYVNIATGVLFMLCYSYQVFYLILGTVKKTKKYAPAPKTKRYAVCIAARNEESVISQLLESIKRQNYPHKLIDIYIVADNCTDNTADIAREYGANVFERFNQEKIG